MFYNFVKRRYLMSGTNQVHAQTLIIRTGKAVAHEQRNGVREGTPSGETAVAVAFQLHFLHDAEVPHAYGHRAALQEDT